MKQSNELYNDINFIVWIEENHQDAILTDYDIEQSYESMLDDCYENVKIAGYSYSTSEALKCVDPIAFRCGLSDYSSDSYIEISGGKFYLSNDSYEDLCNEYEEHLESILGDSV